MSISNTVIYDDSTNFVEIPADRARGLVPRDYGAYPVGYLGATAPPFDMPLIPRSEWKDRLATLKAAKAQLSDIRNSGMLGRPIPSRDQNGRGYCWAHSSVSACLLVRAANHQPYSDLSAYAVACIIKNYRDQGGWGSESLEWIASNGVPSSATWPQQGTQRSLDTPAMRVEARRHRVTEWMDFDPSDPEYVDQFVTCLLLNIPVVSDFNWWGHSVCTMDLVDIDPSATGRNLVASLQTRIWNSWGDSWSDNGTGILKGRKALPDGAVAPRVLVASSS